MMMSWKLKIPREIKCARAANFFCNSRMFCQHTEPAVYYTCRVSSSCDDLKLGEYTTTQDTFRILLNNIYKTKTHPIFHWYLFWNVKLLVVYFLVVFIGKPCHVCKYQPWLTNEYHQKKMIFSIFDCCPPSFLTCVGWRRSCRWDLHISLPSLSPVLQLGSVCTASRRSDISSCFQSGRRGGKRKGLRW